MTKPRGPLSHYLRRTRTPEVGDEAVLVKLGETVRRLRELHGWSQTTLGERVGHRQVWVSRLERGVMDPGVASLPMLAKALRVSVGALVG
jgi:ribosome-binding protein aMBF1 (putative translation factor)